MTDTPHNIHLDTQFLYAYSVSDGYDEEADRKAQINCILHNPNPLIQAKISFTAVGETVNEINKKITRPKDRWSAISELNKLLLDGKVDTIPATESVFKIAHKIKKQDSRLDDTDIFIVSHAICDKYAYLALFQDRNIIESEILRDMCLNRESCKGFCHPLKIKDSYP